MAKRLSLAIALRLWSESLLIAPIVVGALRAATAPVSAPVPPRNQNECVR